MPLKPGQPDKRAYVIEAGGNTIAPEKLASALRIITAEPGALELRRLQMVAEVGAEHNSTTVIAMPMDRLSETAITTATASAIAERRSG